MLFFILLQESIHKFEQFCFKPCKLCILDDIGSTAHHIHDSHFVIIDDFLEIIIERIKSGRHNSDSAIRILRLQFTSRFADDNESTKLFFFPEFPIIHESVSFHTILIASRSIAIIYSFSWEFCSYIKIQSLNSIRSFIYLDDIF